MNPLTLVLGAVAATGTAKSFNLQKQAVAAQQKQQELQARASQRQALREAQIRRASGMVTSTALGAGQSSLATGGVSSLGAQLGAGLGFASQMSGLSNQITSLGSQAQLWGDVSALSGAAFKGRGGWDSLLGVR